MPITGGFVSRNQREKIFKSGTYGREFFVFNLNVSSYYILCQYQFCSMLLITAETWRHNGNGFRWTLYYYDDGTLFNLYRVDI